MLRINLTAFMKNDMKIHSCLSDDKTSTPTNIKTILIGRPQGVDMIF